jgi:hypothetical protein
MWLRLQSSAARNNAAQRDTGLTDVWGPQTLFGLWHAGDCPAHTGLCWCRLGQPAERGSYLGWQEEPACSEESGDRRGGGQVGASGGRPARQQQDWHKLCCRVSLLDFHITQCCTWCCHLLCCVASSVQQRVMCVGCMRVGLATCAVRCLVYFAVNVVIVTCVSAGLLPAWRASL